MGTLSRIERLDQLESWLKSDDPLILRNAAEELGVSLFTVIWSCSVNAACQSRLSVGVAEAFGCLRHGVSGAFR